MSLFDRAEVVDGHLSDLADALEIEDSGPFELLVCGGAALAATGLVERATDDIDVLALVVDGEEAAAKPFPEELRNAAGRVARTRGLPEKWLNPGPADMQEFGLPDGIVERATPKSYGELLTAHFLGRHDQIHLKLYAAVDQSGGKHLSDLNALEPTTDELATASGWAMQQDPSEGFRGLLIWFLKEQDWDGVVDEIL